MRRVSHFFNVTNGWALSSATNDAAPGSAVLIEPASGENRNRWLVEPVWFSIPPNAPYAGWWHLRSLANEGRTALTLGSRSGDCWPVTLETFSDPPQRRQMWFMETHDRLTAEPSPLPYPWHIRLWARTEDEVAVILTLDPRCAAGPQLSAVANPGAGAESHWLPAFVP